ncbi:hypothetical protein [Aquisphaera insulae]|uniref:hypothetical protein n=1 Tax=Aquisphaera insulae TaxID=2712864 RepID=UPI0013EA60BA|nr:hypothetical protein [Aquisphaera insulae]
MSGSIFKYVFHGETVHIDVDALAAKHPDIGRLLAHCEQVAGDGRKATARQAVAGFIARVTRLYGEHYLERVTSALERISRARGVLADEIEATLRGTLPDLTKVKNAFDEMDLAFPEVLSPEEAAKEAPKLPVEALIGTRKPPPAPDKVMGRVRAAVSRLPARAAALVERVRQLDPEALSRAITAEAEETLNALAKRLRTTQGWNPSEADELLEALKDLNKEWRRLNDPKVAADLTAELAAEIKKLPDRLRGAVQRSRALRDLFHTNREQLLEYWSKYSEKPRRYGFGLYVWFNMFHVKGQIGEYGAAFDLGNVVIFLKGPEGRVTQRGTDLVGIDRFTGELLLIDNKALRARIVDKVSALIKNIARNMGDDLADFRQRLVGREVPPRVQEVLNNLARANEKIERLLSEPGRDPDGEQTRQEIANILEDNHIRRMVTPAGGQSVDVAAALDKLGLDFEDLNAPVGD